MTVKNHLIPDNFTNTFEEVKSILTPLKGSHFKSFEKNQPILLQSMIDHTSFLPEDVTIQERKFCIMNDIHSRPTCKMCDAYVRFDRRGPNYKTYCSNACAGKDSEIVERRKKTTMERYGVEVSSQHPDVVAKAKQTNLERYGYTSVLADMEYRKKCMKDKYGYEFPMQNPELSKKVQKFRAEHMEEIIEKTKKNSREKWGYDFPLLHPEVQAKAKATNKERYGAENPFGSLKIQKKIKATNKEIYGFETAYKSQQVKDAAVKTSLERYGTSNPLQNEEIKQRLKDTNNERYGTDWYFQSQHFRDNAVYTNISKDEQLVADFIQHDLGLEIVQSDRVSLPSGKELDIYIPSKNIAIEYCGLYWHSDRFVNLRTHKDKFDESREQNIQLITIFDDEWQHAQEQVKLRLAMLLNCSQAEHVYARKCKVQEIDKNSAQSLLEKYHLQGKVKASVYLGLIHNDELVSVMTFVKRRTGHYELNRFVSTCVVPGGFTKLLTHFKRNYEFESIYSFADCRWSWGEVYANNGFELVDTIRPDYYYTNGRKRFHKFMFRKNAISRHYGIDMTNKTEQQAMKELGFLRIYDCGKYKFMLQS